MLCWFIAQELYSTRFKDGIFYWSTGALAEVDFILTDGEKIFPVEVKAGVNLQAKSLKVFMEKYRPSGAIRFLLAGLKLDGKILNIPLYFIFNFEHYIKKAGF